MRYLLALVVLSSLLILPAFASAKTTMQWAHADYRGGIYHKPDGNLKKHGKSKLWFLTEDGFPEVYRVFQNQRYTDSQGREWIKIALPARPNGQKGWVLRTNLGTIYSSRMLLTVNRRSKQARLYRYSKTSGRSRLIWKAPIGVGKRSTPTPRGNFWVRERIRNLGGKGLYGPLAFGTSAYSSLSDWPGGGVIGIHGTDQPYLLPGSVSHGCIRVRNDNIRRLGKLMRIGTPVRIR